MQSLQHLLLLLLLCFPHALSVRCLTIALILMILVSLAGALLRYHFPFYYY
jgi:hypothetical protein